MLERLDYLWRLTLTGMCFATFCVGGSLASVLVFPPLRLLPGGRERYRLRSQRFVQRAFALLIGTLRTLGVMRLELENAEALRQCERMLVFANHPTYLDVVILLSLMPRASCVVTSRLWASPFYGGVVRAAGYIRNDAPERLIDDCAAALADGQPLIVFPEGTRSVPGQPLHLSRGAAHIALRSGRDILPVVLRCDPPTLAKGMPWYRIPVHAFRYRVEAGTPIRITDHLTPGMPASLAARRLTAHLEQHFTQELKRHDRT